jgi:CHRD domain/PEP-CTERM motif
MKTTRRISWILAAVLGLASQLASATIITYTAALSSANQSPPNASPGTGSVSVMIDTGLNTMGIDVSFSGLLGITTASHIHCCTAAPGTGNVGVATQVPTFIDFPLGVTSGTYTHTFDLGLDSTYNPAFELANGGTAASAEAALLAGLNADEAYLNIHTDQFPAGEIRGFLTAVPEPDSLSLAGLALSGLLVMRRRK